MIGIIDYGMGNLASVYKAVKFTGNDAVITSDYRVLESADAIILPGVGAMPNAMKNLENLGLTEYIPDMISKGKPFLGICLGLQLLFDYSYEGADNSKANSIVKTYSASQIDEEINVEPTETVKLNKTRGLGVLTGEAVKFPDMPHLKIPHMGWNKLNVTKSRYLNGGEYVYFVHSYYVKLSDYSAISSYSRHGVEFVASIERNNIFATQFHPEKSGEVGIAILRKWIEANKRNSMYQGTGFYR